MKYIISLLGIIAVIAAFAAVAVFLVTDAIRRHSGEGEES